MSEEEESDDEEGSFGPPRRVRHARRKGGRSRANAEVADGEELDKVEKAEEGWDEDAEEGTRSCAAALSSSRQKAIRTESGKSGASLENKRKERENEAGAGAKEREEGGVTQRKP